MTPRWRFCGASSHRKESAHLQARFQPRFYSDGQPHPITDAFRYAAELVVIDPLGWQVAEITLGARSGSYLVSMPGTEDRVHAVSADHPERVVRLVSGYREAVTG